MRALLAALIVAAPVLAGPPARSELAAGHGSASTAVAGPVSFTLRSYAADIEVVASAVARVSIAVTDRAAPRVALVSAGGDRIEADFSGKRQLHDGKVRLELPRGSSIDVSAVTGRVSVAGLGGGVRVRGMSGAVKIADASEADVETVDGNVEVSDAAGEVRIHTTSGNAQVSSSVAAAKLEAESSSGSMTFKGACAKGCHLDVDTVSGEVHFELDRKSSFDASVISTSGKVRDDIVIGLRRKHGEAEGAWVEGTYGAADGLIECETFSGNIEFKPR